MGAWRGVLRAGRARMKGRARWVRERGTTAQSSASNCFEKHVGESSSILADALELGEAVVGELGGAEEETNLEDA